MTGGIFPNGGFGRPFEYVVNRDTPREYVETLVPLAVATTPEQRLRAGFVEPAYQDMLGAMRASIGEAAGGLEPLLVLESDGRPVSGGTSYASLDTLDEDALLAAGLDEHELTVALGMYAHACEIRDLEVIEGSGLILSNLLNTTMNELVQEFMEAQLDKLSIMCGDGEISEEAYEAAVRQTRRDMWKGLWAAPEEPARKVLLDARLYRAFGQYAAVAITPSSVRDALATPELYPDLSEEQAEEIANCAAQNFVTDDWVDEMVDGQVLAEAINLLGEPRSQRKEREAGNPTLSQARTDTLGHVESEGATSTREADHEGR